MRKGFILTPEAIFSIFALAFVVFILALSTGIVGKGLPQGKELMDYIDSLFGMRGDIASEDYQTAKQSLMALSCAVNSTSWERKLPCVEDYQEEGSAVVECKFIEESKKQTYMTADKSGFLKRSARWLGKKYSQAKGVLGSIVSVFSSQRVSEDLGLIEKERVESKAWEGCYVKNFQLPQEVSKEKTILGLIKFSPEAWISGYGDPKFLVYWQQFPEGEDSAWTGFYTALENVGTIVLFALPFGSLFRAGKSLAGGALKWTWNSLKGGGKKLIVGTIWRLADKGVIKGETALGRYLLKKSGKEAADKFAESVAKELDDYLAQTVGRGLSPEQAAVKMADDRIEYLEGIYARELSEGEKAAERAAARETVDGLEELATQNIMSAESGITKEMREQAWKEAAEAGFATAGDNIFKKMRDALNSRFGQKAQDFMKAVGYGTAAAYVGALLDSINDKYEKIDGALVLDNPFREPLPVQTDTGRYIKILRTYGKKENPEVHDYLGEVMVLQKSPPKIFYLASPCRADLKVTEETVYCKKYHYDEKTKSVFCDVTTEYEACFHYYRGNKGEAAAQCVTREGRHEVLWAYECDPISLDPESKKGGATEATWCYVKGFSVDVDKISTGGDPNFCYTQSSIASEAFLGASLAVNVVLAFVPGGIFVEVPLGIVEGLVYVEIKKAEKWPMYRSEFLADPDETYEERQQRMLEDPVWKEVMEANIG